MELQQRRQPRQQSINSRNRNQEEECQDGIDKLGEAIKTLPSLSITTRLNAMYLSLSTDGLRLGTLSIQALDVHVETASGVGSVDISLGNLQLWDLSPDMPPTEIFGRHESVTPQQITSEVPESRRSTDDVDDTESASELETPLTAQTTPSMGSIHFEIAHYLKSRMPKSLRLEGFPKPNDY